MHSFPRRVIPSEQHESFERSIRESKSFITLLATLMRKRLDELETKEGDLNDPMWPHKRALADGRRLETKFWMEVLNEHNDHGA